jgi:aryl sulfotransferase
MRYRSVIADSGRWEGFEFRPDDIVISTPPKCGTTWVQMLCALLIFDGPEFPAPLDEMSPWIDMCNQSIESVRAKLAAQSHRRFIKTHTPLDGIPIREEVTYVVVGRDPRDVAVSFEHHRANMDIAHFFELRAQVMGTDDLEEFGPAPISDDPAEDFREFVRSDSTFGPPTLAGVLHHMQTAWRRRRDGNVVMVHYADLTADLPGEMRRLAAALGIPLTEVRASELAREARLDRMRARARELAPESSRGNWKDAAAFFRVGGFGEWRNRVDEELVAEYEARVASLVPADVAAWTHLGRIASGIDPDA